MLVRSKVDSGKNLRLPARATLIQVSVLIYSFLHPETISIQVTLPAAKDSMMLYSH